VADYDWTPCQGCYNNYLTVFNTDTGKSFKPVCKSYTCTKHGWMQKVKLQKALQKHFEEYDHVRMWTFSITTRMSADPFQHYKSLTLVWQRFITELRRNKLFTVQERDLQYVRVAEQFQSGYWHFHLMVDRWLNQDVAQVIWEHCAREELGCSGHTGQCNVVGTKSAKDAAYYVAKYVTKSALLAYKRQKLWTKSSKISIYPPKDKTQTFVTWDSRRAIWIGLDSLRDLTCSIYVSTYRKSPLIDLFPDYVHRE